MDSPARPSQPKMASSTGGTEGSSPASSPASAASLAAMAAPKFGTLVPNRIFVGGISASTSEAELAQLFSAYGNVKATKIIADRGGVSKGYGFVTFETEEEAKRLQQESECIVLRERKLNIAPAIKKQPFNRSFDGGTGSPPAVPTSTYYYTNGMGLPYQNGMTFYNAGAPAPGAAMAPPTDPATLYQAAGVFGPQATASHQTFAPVMYPVPAPSLYMPQQYQYSPMPYEPYYPGTTAAGAPQFLYATNGAQTTTGGSGNGSGNSGSGTASGGAGATSPASAAPSLGPSPPQFQAHFYGPATTATHHHPGALAGAPHAPPPPPPQMEHLYYSYPPPPHGAQPPPHHSGQLTLGGDQQLLVYTTEITSQNSANDSQVSQQEDSRSTSSHSEQLQQAGSGGTATSDSGGGGGGGQPPDPSAPPTMLPLMPLKYPLSNRYATFHPMTIQQQQQSSSSPHQQTSTATNPADGGPTSDDLANAPVTHYRTMSLYPSPLYIPPGAQYHPSTGGGSLLPTPPQQPYDLGAAAAAKFRDYSKSGLVSHPYAKGPPPGTSPLLHHQSAYVKQYNGPPLHPPPPAHAVAAHQKYPRVTTPPARLSHHQSYGKRSGPLGHQQHQHHHLGSPAYYFSQKSCQYGAPSARGAQHFVCGGQPGQLSAYSLPHIPNAHNSHKGYASYEYGSSGRRSVGSEYTSDGYSASRQASRKNAIVNSYRGSNLTLSAAASNTTSSVDASSGSNSSSTGKAQPSGKVASETSVSETSATATVTTTTTATTTTAAADSTSSSNSSSATTEKQASATTAPSSASDTPPPTSYSPMTRPHPNLSPSPNLNTQVQFFGTGSGGGGGGGGGSCSTPGQRFNTSSSSSLSQQQQQQRNSGTRYPMTVSSRGGKAANMLRQNSGGGGGGGGGGGTKYKMNGIVQSSGKLPLEENSLGGAGDAPPVGRLPLTPPGTPQQTSSEQNQQLNESCHQMQALTL